MSAFGVVGIASAVDAAGAAELEASGFASLSLGAGGAAGAVGAGDAAFPAAFPAAGAGAGCAADTAFAAGAVGAAGVADADAPEVGGGQICLSCASVNDSRSGPSPASRLDFR